MKQYRLINQKTKEEHICTKVSINGFDYYVNDNKNHNGYVYNELLNQIETMFDGKTFGDNLKSLVASNNPNLNIPQVVNQVEQLADDYVFMLNGGKFSNNNSEAGNNFKSFKDGYNKAKETYQFTEEDMLNLIEDFVTGKFQKTEEYKSVLRKVMTPPEEALKQLLNLWKEQQIQTTHYE